MEVESFDEIAIGAIIISIAYTLIVAILSWNWFPTPGDWGDTAHIPKNIKNYIALLLPPIVTLSCLLICRLYFKKQF